MIIYIDQLVYYLAINIASYLLQRCTDLFSDDNDFLKIVTVTLTFDAAS
jgi:hypothetical protein